MPRVTKSAKKRETREARARQRARDEFYIAVAMGLLALLILVGGYVLIMAPPAADPQFSAQWLNGMESRLQFFEAKRLVKSLVNQPIEKWSALLSDPGCGCVPVHADLWFAIGTVDTRGPDGTTAHLPWRIVFRTGATQPLYAQVGSKTFGDMAEAQREISAP